MKNGIIKPTTLSGFMELLPEDQIEFNRIMDKIRSVYEKYGFIPMDTPVIEKSEILLAKGGGETEKQIYRFNKGDTDLSLRFDLTVPLARYVAQHMDSLTFPFRRYQIGKVYRGERSQKGRYREFYQCDIDIIGNEKLSIINDAQIPSVIYSIFKDLDISDFTIHINNRKIINGFFDSLGIKDKVEALRIIDKVDKIGIENVESELVKIGVDEEAIGNITQFISLKTDSDGVLDFLKKLNIENDTFLEGAYELTKVMHYIRSFGILEKNCNIDLKIARGLDYYTGTVFETTLDNYPEIGSVCSGGRYDNLAENYTNKKLPGVGISIGLTRLFSKLKELNVLNDSHNRHTLTEVLIIPVEDTVDYCIEVSNKLREANIITEIYFEDGNVAKKLKYANKLCIPTVLLIGEEEVTSRVLTLKEMNTGEQHKILLEDLIQKLQVR